MSDTIKVGKRRYRIIKHKPRNLRQSNIVSCRHTFGSTEKILRRNRRIWEKLYAKIGRQIDKKEVISGLFDYILNRCIIDNCVSIEY